MQGTLDDEEKSEISVHTKAPEIIGYLTCVMWIYGNAFQCIAKEQPLHIPEYITQNYLKNAEEVVNMSYSHSETFSSVSINVTLNLKLHEKRYIHRI